MTYAHGARRAQVIRELLAARQANTSRLLALGVNPDPRPAPPPPVPLPKPTADPRAWSRPGRLLPYEVDAIHRDAKRILTQLT